MGYADRLRERVQERLRREITPRRWSMYVAGDRDAEGGRGLVSECETFDGTYVGDDAFEALVADVADQLFPAREREDRLGGDVFAHLRQRRDALTAWAIALARREAAGFRSSVLRDDLLSPEGVDGWIVAKATEQDHGPGPELEWLRWQDGEPRLISERVTAHDDLRRLGDLAARLRRAGYGWSRWEALHFVLTDDAPPVDPIRAGWTPHQAFDDSLPAPFRDVFSSVTLEIDPAVSPVELAEFWRDIRRRAHPHAGRRVYTPQQPKALALAKFGAEHIEDDSPIDGVLREEWNERYPDWHYAPRSHFDRDLADASRNLLHRRLAWTLS